MKNIYYWFPFIGNIETIKAVINSAYSLSKYSNNGFILMHCTGNANRLSEVDKPIMYGDYYFLEAMLRVKNK